MVYRIEGDGGWFSRVVHSDRLKKHYKRRTGVAQDSESSSSEDESDLEVYVDVPQVVERDVPAVTTPNAPAPLSASAVDPQATVEPGGPRAKQFEQGVPEQAAPTERLEDQSPRVGRPKKGAQAAHTLRPEAPPTTASQRENRGVPPARYGKDVLMIVCFIFILPLALVQDVVVLQQLGAVGEKWGEVAITEETARFTMVLRLALSEPKFLFNNCTSDAIDLAEKKETADTPPCLASSATARRGDTRVG